MKKDISLITDSQQLFKNQLNIVAIYEEKCVHDKVVNYLYDGTRNAVSIHYVLAGKGTLYIKSKAYVVEGRQSFYVPPYEVVRYVADIKDPWHYVWVELRGEYALRIASFIGFSPNSPVLTPKSREIQSIFFKMLERKLTHTMNDLEFYSDIFLLVKALKNDNGTQSGLLNKHIQDALTYIHNNYMNNISLSDIALNSNLNARYLSKIFKDEMQVTPINYLIDLRLKKAESLFKKTNKTIKEIAAEVGFQDPLYFSKVFRTYFKMSPRSYQRIVRDNEGKHGK